MKSPPPADTSLPLPCCGCSTFWKTEWQTVLFLPQSFRRTILRFAQDSIKPHGQSLLAAHRDLQLLQLVPLSMALDLLQLPVQGPGCVCACLLARQCFFPVAAHPCIWVRHCLNSDCPAHTEPVRLVSGSPADKLWPLLSVLSVEGPFFPKLSFSCDFFSLVSYEMQRDWWIDFAVACDLNSRCDPASPQGLHTSAIVPVTHRSPSPWQHHKGGL